MEYACRSAPTLRDALIRNINGTITRTAPVAVLPAFLQPFAWALPPTYVFEGMRAILIDQTFRADLMIQAFALNAVYFAVAVYIFIRLLDSARRSLYLSSLSDAIRPLSNSVRIQAETVRLLGNHLRASRVAFIDVEPDGSAYVQSSYEDGLPEIGGEVGGHVRGHHPRDRERGVELERVDEGPRGALVGQRRPRPVEGGQRGRAAVAVAR